MNFVPNEIELAIKIAKDIENIADNGIALKELTLSGDVLLQCQNRTIKTLGELNSVVLPYLKKHKRDLYDIVKENRDLLLKDMRELKEIAEQGNKVQWPDKVQNKLRNLAKALRASSDKAGNESINQKRKRATKQEKENKEAAILKACYDLEQLYHVKPKTEQIAKETGFSQPEIRNSTAYKDGRIAKKTAKDTTENIPFCNVFRIF